MIATPTAVLIDFDGVLRQFDPAVSAAIETAHGLEPGAVLAAGMQWDSLLPAIIGQISREQWLADVAESFTGTVEDPQRLLAEWGVYKGEIAKDVLQFVRDARAAGIRVALATNAMDDLDDMLALHGLSNAFDAVASSASIGVHKPAPGYFRAACALLGTPQRQCMLIDDDDRNVRGARAAGLTAYRYTPGDDLTYTRKALGI